MADQLDAERARRNLKPRRAENSLRLGGFAARTANARVLRSKKWTVKGTLFRKDAKEL